MEDIDVESGIPESGITIEPDISHNQKTGAQSATETKKLLLSAECTPQEQLYNMIDKIQILLGRVSSDDTIWEFHIDNKKVCVPARKLINQRAFHEAFLNAFNFPAPVVSKLIWFDLIHLLYLEKATEIPAPEESESVLAARAVLDTIREMPITSEDCAAVVVGQAVYHHKGYYWITVKKVREIIEALHLGFGSSKISDILTQLCMKEPGTPSHQLGDAKPRCWQIKPEGMKQD